MALTRKGRNWRVALAGTGGRESRQTAYYRCRDVPQPADRAFRRDQPLPDLLVDLWRQFGLVEVEIAAPQLCPARPALWPDRGDDDVGHGAPSPFLSPVDVA